MKDSFTAFCEEVEALALSIQKKYHKETDHEKITAHPQSYSQYLNLNMSEETLLDKKISPTPSKLMKSGTSKDSNQRIFSRNGVLSSENVTASEKSPKTEPSVAKHENLRKSNDIFLTFYNKNLQTAPIIETFTDLKLSPAIYDNLRLNNMVIATPIQMQAIPLFLLGYNFFGQSPTGTGKTLCFLLPLVLIEKNENFTGAVILLPTRELCIQIEQCFKPFTNILGIYGESTGFLTKESKNKIIVATPGRLCQILEKKNFIANFSHLVLDEFDKMTSKEFQNSISKIHSFMKQPQSKLPQVCVLSATLTDRFALKLFKFDCEIVIGQSNAINENILQKLVYTSDKFGKLLELIEKNLVVFVNSKEQADELVVNLQATFYKKEINLEVDSLHGGKSQIERNEITENFHSKKIDILICTGLMSRGIDFNVKKIINYEIPSSLTDFIHRTGRTGRYRHGFTQKGIALTLSNTKHLPKYFADIKDKLEIIDEMK